MTGIYYTEVDEVLRAAGLIVRDDSYNAGWQTRARSSGGFPAPPLGVMWHHTASNKDPSDDLYWQCVACDDAPVGNMLIDRDGVVWPVAAGASNCSGKGGPMTFSRGTCPTDSGNTNLWNIECANDGVGGSWSVATIDAYFAASNALNALFGNRPDDVTSHALGAGDGYTDRKIDPAVAWAVQGGWQPSSVNSSGTWSLADLRAECLARAAAPTPTPEDDMTEEQAAQLQALYDGLVVVGGNAGQVDPAGQPVNTPWLLWYVNLKVDDLNTRLQALEQ